MENVIIGIHGLGNKPPKDILKYWWEQAMIEGLKTNNYTSSLPKFEMVYWADILYDQALDPKEKDTDSPVFLNEKYAEANPNFEVEDHSTRKKVVKFLSQQLNRVLLNHDLSLNYSYITDAIVSKYFKDLEVYYSDESILKNDHLVKTKDLINNRLIQVLEKYKNHNIMLISHSMGSIIAFDVLNFLTPHIPINTFVTIGSPLGLPIVIGKIAAEQKQRKITENLMATPASVSKNWFNFSDILDKVAFNYKLDDDFSENSNGIKPIDFLVTNNYEINGEKNPHKSFGYLRTAEFSEVLNAFNLSESLSVKEKILQLARQFIRSLQNLRRKN